MNGSMDNSAKRIILNPRHKPLNTFSELGKAIESCYLMMSCVKDIKLTLESVNKLKTQIKEKDEKLDFLRSIRKELHDMSALRH